MRKEFYVIGRLNEDVDEDEMPGLRCGSEFYLSEKEALEAAKEKTYTTTVYKVSPVLRVVCEFVRTEHRIQNEKL